MDEVLIVGGKYKRGRKISRDFDAFVYEGTNMETGEQVAMKLESQTIKHPQLSNEARVYREVQGGTGIAKIRWFGYAAHSMQALVMDMLGPDLKTLLQACSNRFSLKTVLMLADQMIDRLQYLHSKSFVYRALKPANIVVDCSAQANKIYLIDFGFARKYRDDATLVHFPCKGRSAPRIPYFCSINAHTIGQSRRDDLESLGYVLMYFLRGSLQWEGALNVEEAKIAIPLEVLCESHPSEFATYIRYCRSLGYAEQPDYAYLKTLFQELFTRQGFELDYVFDWTGLNVVV